MSQNKILVHRFDENPLITIKDADWLKRYPWFWRGVLNCGVTYDDRDHLFKMLFRGGVGIFCQLGYAESIDGISWQVYKKPTLKLRDNWIRDGHLILGIEDPRIVKFNNWHYIFASACLWDYYLLGGKQGKVGIWRTQNFIDYEWIGFPLFDEAESKNAAIFPETINQHVYLLYRDWPDIYITKSKNLFLMGNWVDKKLLLSIKDVYQKDGVYPKKIGIAGPPIKTPKGWLLIFHAKFGENLIRNFYYNLGFMVLNLHDPSKIEYLHPEPILWPEKDEEKFGFHNNVVFSCATIDKGDDKIYIYWGGADTVVCGGYLKKEDLPMCY